MISAAAIAQSAAKASCAPSTEGVIGPGTERRSSRRAEPPRETKRRKSATKSAARQPARTPFGPRKIDSSRKRRVWGGSICGPTSSERGASEPFIKLILRDRFDGATHSASESKHLGIIPLVL